MKTVYHVLQEDLRPHIGRLAGVIFFMLCAVGLEALAPWPFKFLIDNVLSDVPIPFPSFFHTKVIFGMAVVLIFFFANILLNIVEYLRSVALKDVIRRIIFDFSRSAFMNIERLNFGFYRTQEIGDYIYKLNNDVSALGVLIEDGILPIITSSLYVVVTSIILLTIDVKLTLISLIALPLLAGGLYFFNKRIELVSHRSEHWNSQVFSFIQEALSQLKIIQAFTQERREAKEFNQKMRTSLDTEYHLHKLNFLLSLVIGLFIAMSYSVIIGFGITQVFKEQLTTGLLVIFIFYLDNLTNPILSIIYAVSTFKENRVRVEHMSSFFNKKAQTKETGIVEHPKESSVELKHVSLISNEGTPILHDISFRVEPHQFTVLVGVSGSGKTSVISLIPRLINEPTKGQILIGETPVNEYNVHTLREMVSLVPQENVLFNETIRDIIAYGKPNASDEEIEEAARQAVADDFIKALPGKYNFKVGEGGNYLSGGQRQRLSIARAFLKRPEIFIFDEPLSSLDLQTRKKVWNNLLKVTKGKTTIVVSNVLDVITHADQVVVMSEGKILHSGKHRDLFEHSDSYKLIVRAQ